jgi:hypothetical protein
MGQAQGKSYSFGEGLYRLWLRMDLLAMCAAKKQSGTTLQNGSQ